MENSKLTVEHSLPRRKILGWLGLGAVGALILKMVPMRKTISKKFMSRSDERISISINEHAVKRSRKVTRNV